MHKNDLYLRKPIMNAAGILGFSPDPKSGLDYSKLGAFVTNPISLTARTPARGPRQLSFPGGILMHTGYPNPGINQVIRKYARKWEKSPIPIIVNLLAQEPDSIWKMVQRLENLDTIFGVEIGLPPETDVNLAREMAQAAIGELVVGIKVPFENSNRITVALAQSGIDAISISPPRGILPNANDGFVSGRIYGPSVFPLALAQVERLTTYGIPIIGSGGIYQSKDVTTMLATGATAVQIDTQFWRGKFL